MKKKERKALEEKLLAATNVVLQANKIDLTNKTENALEKSIRQIAKNIAKNNNGVSPKKNNEAGLNSERIKTDTGTAVSSL